MNTSQELDLSEVPVPDYEPDEVSELVDDEDKKVRTEFLTGPAGSGKTYTLKQRIAADPKYGILCATTGVAAVNLDTVTLNSVLKYFDTESLEGRYVEGYLQRDLAELSRSYRNLIIDEVSMMDARQLDLIVSAVEETAGMVSVKNPLGVIVVGDFCQLPPIKSKFAFEADCWPQFAANTTRLEKIWRQENLEFLQALNLLRRGDGKAAGKLLRDIGVKFASAPDLNFVGTTIFGKNDPVNRFNDLRLKRLPGETMVFRPWKWGKQLPQWAADKGLIPDPLVLKVGAQVMILANDVVGYQYANGDQGLVKSYDANLGALEIELLRNGRRVLIQKIHRKVEEKAQPQGVPYASGPNDLGNPYYDPRARRWVMGGIEYYPIRLGWASTTHKSQGLTLDQVQIDLRDFFFAQPGMAYVAVSRCRAPEGLRIVGDPELLSRRNKVDEKVREWL
jgi:ATP-dependent exoDNAse (exonuclease V) alpha subunit